MHASKLKAEDRLAGNDCTGESSIVRTPLRRIRAERHRTFCLEPANVSKPAREPFVAMGAKPDDVWPVRLVSHHLRLLGLLRRGPERELLVPIDYDATKEP